jgi:hypothetical protein
LLTAKYGVNFDDLAEKVQTEAWKGADWPIWTCLYMTGGNRDTGVHQPKAFPIENGKGFLFVRFLSIR